MIGSLVTFIYNEDNMDNICIILQKYGEEDLEQEEALFLIYDMKNKDFFYALEEELSFI